MCYFTHFIIIRDRDNHQNNDQRNINLIGKNKGMRRMNNVQMRRYHMIHQPGHDVQRVGHK